MQVAIETTAVKRPKVTGREATSWLSGASSITQLAVGAAWVNDEIDIDDLTPTMKARALGLKPKEVKAIAALPAEQRAGLINKRRTNGAARMPDTVLDKLVERIGTQRLWAAIDRATTPKSNE